ncbi:hypothetical protein [Streptomyces mirabilis]|uniref:hypothetical protein n=1 Tax=Streptomyces mirabilis TaxID=68239 RepID=UPI001C434DC9
MRVLADLLADLPLPNLHLLVVDDNSPDDTGEVADVVIQMDAGLSHPASAIPGMVDTLLTKNAVPYSAPATWRAARPPRMAMAPQGPVSLGRLLRQRDPAPACERRHRRIQGTAGRTARSRIAHARRRGAVFGRAPTGDGVCCRSGSRSG